jgi:signal transduction histidine kinase
VALIDVLTWPVLGSLAAGGGSLYLARYLLQYWEKPGARWFIFSLTAQAVFCLVYGVGLTITDPALRETAEIVAVIALNWLGVPFLGFVLEYTGRGKLLRSRAYRALYVQPLFVTVLLPANAWHGLFWTDFQIDSTFGVATVTYSFEPLFYITVLGGTMLGGVGALLLFDTVWSYGPLYRGEALAVGLSFLPPSIGLFAWLLGVGPAEQLNVLVYLLLPHIALDAFAFIGSGMFEFHPATSRAAERAALEDLRQPVLVLDEAGRVVEMNAAAEELFCAEESAITRPVSAVVGAEIPPDVTERRLSIQSDGQQAEFRIDSSPLTDSGGNHVGYLLLFQNITEEVQRKEQLAVLNRVLRHNLRNKLTVAQGHIQVASQTVTDEAGASSLEQAEGALRNLLDTSEQAREVERVLGGNSDRQSVELRPLLERLAEQTAERDPNASVAVESPALSVRTNELLLQAVISQLLENAVEHTDSPVVTVRVETGDEYLTLAVEDEGPGIPDHELRVLESGEETALEHGSGLGLWLIRWGVDRLGGDIEFQTGPDGTRAVVSLPSTIVEDKIAIESDPTGRSAAFGVTR